MSRSYNLFDLARMAFAVESSLAIARRDTSMIQTKNRQTLSHALTIGEIFDMTLEQGLDHVLSDKDDVG